jgi:predicted dehydrogenase
VTLRCGLVGTGHWMRLALLPALQAHPQVEIVGCVGATAAEALSFAEKERAGAPFPDLGAMLAVTGRPDFVVIATPDHMHAPALTAALEAGVAAYCEKPLANDFATATRLAELGERSGVAATVGYSFRFNPAIQALKRDLEAGRLGDPWLIELAEHNPQFHPHGGKALNWKGDPSQAAGGALFEYGSHVLDLSTWLLGPVRRVSSSLQRVLPGARLDDIATLQMTFESGARGTLVASWVLTGGFPGIRIRLHGSEATAMVQVDDRLPNGQIYTVSPAFGGQDVEHPVEPMGDYRLHAATRHMIDFVAAIQGQRRRHGETLPTLRQGAHVQAVLEAALHATDAWQEVRDT